MFPAFKPHEIAALPTRYFLKLRAYLVEVREHERDAYARASMAGDGMDVVDFDAEVLGKTKSVE